HTWGIAGGLEISAAELGFIEVSPGFALDADGRELILLDTVSIDLRGFLGSRAYVTIRYAEERAAPLSDKAGTHYQRTAVAPLLSPLTSAPDDPSRELLLGAVDLSVFREVVSIDRPLRHGSGVEVQKVSFPAAQAAVAASISAGADPGTLS